MPSRLLVQLTEQVEKFHAYWETGDRTWEFYLPITRRWLWLHVKEFEGVYYFASEAFDSFCFDPRGAAGRADASAAPSSWPPKATLREILSSLRLLYPSVLKEPLASHRLHIRRIPFGMRTGVIARKFLQVALPDYQRFDRVLSGAEIARIVGHLKKPGPQETSKMTAAIYFKYCGVAYRANPTTFGGQFNPSLSGKELYRRWADGRDGGLLDLPPHCETSFREWHESKERAGGHPWEIYRGSNSAHIDLAATQHPGTQKWRVILDAFSSTRLAETCRIALALIEERLPFELLHRESYLQRLLGEDWVGIVPRFDTISYGWHQFPREWGVSDCVHFDPSLRKVSGAIHWLPIRPLLPRSK